jgi:putative sterol carrier protein
MGGEAVASYHSVATPEGGQAVIDSAVTAFGRVDILINNAGILRDRTLAKMEPDEWQAVRGVHLDGAYNVTRPAFIKMREQGYGRIIVTTSAAGLYGNFGQTNYAAAKMGLVGFMTSLKLEGEKHNIKVNAVAPIAASRLTEDVLPPDLLEKVKPEYVAPLVLYLCSEECSENGMIFNAGMGSYNRAAIVSAAGIILGDRITPPTPELIHENWEGIHSLAGAKEVPSLTAALGELIERFKPQGTAEPSRKPELAVSSVFERMPAAFQPDRAAGVDVVFQYDITGPGGGTWYVSIKDGQCEVREGRHEKPTTTIIMSDEDFLSLIRRELDAMQAFTTGKLKVQGDIMKSQLIGKLFKF